MGSGSYGSVRRLSDQNFSLATQSLSEETKAAADSERDIFLALVTVILAASLSLASVLLGGSTAASGVPLLSTVALSVGCFISCKSKARLAAVASSLVASGIYLALTTETDAFLVLLVMATVAALLEFFRSWEIGLKADRKSAQVVILTLLVSTFIASLCIAYICHSVHAVGSFADRLGLALCSVLPALFVRAALIASAWSKETVPGFFFTPSLKRRIAEYSALIVYSVGISFAMEHVVSPYQPMILVGGLLDCLVIAYFYRQSFANLGVALTIMFTAGNIGYALDGFESPLLFATYMAWAFFLAGVIVALRTIELGAGREIIKAEAEAEASKESARIAVAQAKAHEKALANLTHDLKSPIAAVQGLLDWTRQRAKRKENVRELIHLATSQINRLGDLVSNVLEMSHAELDQQKIKYEPLNLRDLLEQVVDDFSLIAKNSGLELDLAIESGAVTQIAHDGLRLRRMISNLVDNACKYTETGGVTLKLETTAMDTQMVGVTISVSDTGIGVPEADKEAIFEKFVRAQNRGGADGLGIGLSIVANMAAAIGASISLESVEGQGSTFIIDFVASAGDVVPSMRVAGHSAAASDKRILIVEDDPIHARITCAVLSEHATVHIAENGEEALKAMAKEKFDLVFMDCRMPVLDGYSTTEEIRSFETAHQNAGIPIVGLTSNATTNEKRRALDCGMDAIFAKPMRSSIASEALGLIVASR